MVSYQELEEWIYGKKSIDVGLLKQNSRLARGYSEDDIQIKWFWEILEEMPQVARRKFICFCFAQYTIPPNEEFERRALRFQIKPVMEGEGKHQREVRGNQDLRLPRADTCFFNFELPKYSSKEVMKKKMLSAMSLDNMSLNAEEENVQMDNQLSPRSGGSNDDDY